MPNHDTVIPMTNTPKKTRRIRLCDSCGEEVAGRCLTCDIEDLWEPENQIAWLADYNGIGT